MTRHFLVVLSVIALCLTTCVHGAIVGIDLGGEFIKLTGPKNNNIDIVLNEQAQRKIFHYIGFRGDERYFGEDAKNFAARFPDNMFSLIHRLAGQSFSNVELRKWFREEMSFKSTLEETINVNPNATEGSNFSTGTISFKTGSNPTISYTAETLLGMMFGYFRDTAEKDTGLKIRDAVVTIPSFFTARQRQAIIDSAALGGLHVVSLLHSTTATALQYGIQKRGFDNETVNVVIYDMGATRTEVGVYTFSPPVVKKGQKVKMSESYGVMTTRAIVADQSLGGRAFDTCIGDLLQARAMREMKPKVEAVMGGETLAARKSIISLLRAANKAKETLSANRLTPLTVEGIAPDREFNTKLSREDFESHCAPYFERAAALLTAAVAKSGIKMENIQAVELMGGGGRVPKVLELLAAARGKPIDRTLNGDEAAAFGAGFYAATQSGRFRIKSFQIVESMFPLSNDAYVGFSLSPNTNANVPTIRQLFAAGSLVGQHKSISLNRTEPFNIHLYRQAGPAVGESSADHQPDTTIHIDGIAEALRSVPFYADEETKALTHPNNSHTVFVELKSAESGLVVLQEAEVRITYARNVSKKVKVNLTDAELEVEREIVRSEHKILMEARDKAKAEKAEKAAADKAAADAVAQAEKAAAEAEKAADGAAATDAEAPAAEAPAADAPADAPAADANATNATAVNATEDKDSAEAREALLARRLAAVKTYKMQPQMVEEMTKHFVPLSAHVTMTYAAPVPLTKDDTTYIKSMLKVWADSDTVKRETSAAKNELDTYIVWAKNEGILENQEMKDANILTPAALEKVTSALTKTTEWMDDTGSLDATTKDEFVAQLAALKEQCKDVLDALKAKTAPSKSAPAAGDNATDVEEKEEKDDDADEPKKADKKAKKAPKKGDKKPKDNKKKNSKKSKSEGDFKTEL